MSLTLKISSLFIRTLAKPIANYIKSNAREHERFKRVCVSFAQGLHRFDMRLRLGLLQDPAVIERQIARELAEAEKKRKAATVPTVKTEAQTLADESAKAKEKEKITESVKSSRSTPRIRPLSEAKAIETGANFISETFMFFVAGGIIVFESWRSRRKENSRREDVADRIQMLESKVDELEAELHHERTGKTGEESKGQADTKTEKSDRSKDAIPASKDPKDQSQK